MFTISLCPVAFRKEGIPLYYFGFLYFQTLSLGFMQGQKSWLCIELAGCAGSDWVLLGFLYEILVHWYGLLMTSLKMSRAV